MKDMWWHWIKKIITIAKHLTWMPLDRVSDMSEDTNFLRCDFMLMGVSRLDKNRVALSSGPRNLGDLNLRIKELRSYETRKDTALHPRRFESL
jgi:hypothetical protein